VDIDIVSDAIERFRQKLYETGPGPLPKAFRPEGLGGAVGGVEGETLPPKASSYQ